MSTDRAVSFARTASLADAPESVGDEVRVRVLDTLAATTAGYRMPGVDVTAGYVADECDGKAATLLDGTGTRRSPAGATLANATAANTLDVDDGHREVKGHPAAVVVPAALAAAEAADATVGTFLDAVVVGYELGVRAGLAIHATDGVYTGTGSWGALGAAAAVARCRDLPAGETAHALGTAAYHAPRTPIMRGVADPGMTKDGVGWGAYAGAVATDLAERGFTGSGTVFDADAVTVTDSLGDRFHVTRSYLKPYPCCRWTHPGVDAVLELRERHDVDPAAVERLRVHTFAEATHLDTRTPGSIEAAEYSYPYAVAVALASGQVTPAELRAETRRDPTVRRLADAVDLVTAPEIDERFPAECLARVELATAERTYESDVTRPRGARERPLSATAQAAKVASLCAPTVDAAGVDRVRAALADRTAPLAEVVAPWQ
ncbi:MmgE/PrpD family protein [Halobacteriales archaeon Cl-PHB]